jgi:tetratricopeptide (TPR) repeat protein
MSEEQRQELVERYLDRQMSEPERAAFDLQVKDDALLSETLALEKAARLVVTEAGREETRLLLETYESEWKTRQPKTRMLPTFRSRLLSLAAVVLALVAAFIWLLKKPSSAQHDLFTAHFAPYRMLSPVRGGGDQMTWEKAAAAYATADYGLAAIRFRESLDSPAAIPYLSHFYLGVSLLAQQPPQAEAAIASFDETLKSDNDFRQPAIWYKSLALLKLQRRTEAKHLLEELLKEGDFKTAEVKALLKILEK